MEKLNTLAQKFYCSLIALSMKQQRHGSFDFFYHICLFILCVCGYMHATAPYMGVRRQPGGVRSLLPPWRSWWSNSGRQSWWQVPSLAEPSCQAEMTPPVSSQLPALNLCLLAWYFTVTFKTNCSKNPSTLLYLTSMLLFQRLHLSCCLLWSLIIFS